MQENSLRVSADVNFVVPVLTTDAETCAKALAASPELASGGWISL
jgi:hypothetical protein